MKSATKFGALVTSIVLLAACSAKQIKQEEQALMQPTPEPIYTETSMPEAQAEASKAPVQESAWRKRGKRKTRIVKKNKAVRTHVAKAGKVKRKSQPTYAAAQVQSTPPAPPSQGLTSVQEMQAQVSAPAVNPVVPPPPAFEAPVVAEGGFFSNVQNNWPMLSVVVMTLALFAVAVRNRMSRKPRRKLIYN